jgi:hypothetical protein
VLHQKFCNSIYIFVILFFNFFLTFLKIRSANILFTLSILFIILIFLLGLHSLFFYLILKALEGLLRLLFIPGMYIILKWSLICYLIPFLFWYYILYFQFTSIYILLFFRFFSSRYILFILTWWYINLWNTSLLMSLPLLGYSPFIYGMFCTSLHAISLINFLYVIL